MAGGLYAGGAIGLELVEGVVALRGGDQGVLYMVLSGVEETAECLGVITLIHALISYGKMNGFGLEVHAEAQAADAEPHPGQRVKGGAKVVAAGGEIAPTAA